MLPRLLHRAVVPAARIAAPLRSVPSRPAAWLSSLSPATAHRGWSVVPGPVPVPAALAVNGAAPSFEPLVPPTPRPAAKPRVELRSVNAVMRNIKGSPRKMNSIVRQLRKLSVIDAQKQMKFSLKRRARPMSKLLRMCALKAEMQFGIPEEHLVIDRACVGKGKYLKRIWYHSRARTGIRMRRFCQLRVYAREMTPEEIERKLRREKRKEYVAALRAANPHPSVERRQWEKDFIAQAAAASQAAPAAAPAASA